MAWKKIGYLRWNLKFYIVLLILERICCSSFKFFNIIFPFIFSMHCSSFNKNWFNVFSDFVLRNAMKLLHSLPLSAKSLQSCLTLCDHIDCSPLGSPIPGILQARTLEWVAISFSNAWKWKGKVKSLSRVWPSATPWTAAYQAPPSMGFSRQEYWSGVPLN